jgi:hypothetical protein
MTPARSAADPPPADLLPADALPADAPPIHALPVCPPPTGPPPVDALPTGPPPVDALPADLLDAVCAAREHIRALAAVLAGAANHMRVPAHVSADVLAHVNHLARDRHDTRDPVLEHARDLARDLGHACGLALDLVCLAGRDRHPDLAADLDRGPFSGAADLAKRLSRDLDLANALGGDPELARTLARRLDRERASARRLVHDIGSAGQASPPGRAYRRLVAGAVLVLPADHRARYAREYAAELWELGSQRGPRRRRLAYALHLAATCWSLRRALTAASPWVKVSTRSGN